jgi:intracellular sulfur oxidation DsrE/DsrF family protein
MGRNQAVSRFLINGNRLALHLTHKIKGLMIRTKLTAWYVIPAIISGFLFVTDAPAQNVQPAPTRDERLKKQESKMVFPFVKGSYLSGVIPVENPSLKADPNKTVKLIFEFTQATSAGKQATGVNEGLEELARILNLHILSGVKKEKLKAAVVFHAGAIMSVLSDNYYQQNYQKANPNLNLLNQLVAAGVDLYICGQSLVLREIPSSMVLPEVKVAVSAKTTLSHFAAEGYYEFLIKSE